MSILLLALGLRLWGIGTGMPYSYAVDEAAHFVKRAVLMFDEGLHPRWFVNPPAFTYLLHGVFAVFSFGGRGMAEQFLRDPEPVWLLARGLSAVSGVAAVGVLYMAGTKFFNRRTGLIAALILAVAFLPVFYGHFALNDSPLLLPTAGALVGIAGVISTGARRWYLLAGASFGLAAATKYSAGIVGVALLLAFLPRAKQEWKRMALAGLVALAAFVIANPYSVIDFPTFADGVAHQAEASAAAGGKVGQIGTGGAPFYIGALGWGVGVIPLVFALGGAVLLAVKDRRRALALVVPVILFLIFMGTYSRWFGRWVMPVIPFVCLLAAWGADRLIERIPARGYLRPALGALLVAALTAQGLLDSIHLGQVFERRDTRAIARSWMRENLPQGSRIVVEPGVVPQRWLGRTISYSQPYDLTQQQRSKRKPWRVLSRDGTFNERPEDYQASLKPSLVDVYRSQGWCIVMTASTQRGRLERDPKGLGGAIGYYNAIERKGKLLFSVAPWADPKDAVPFDYDGSFNYRDSAYRRPGPEIRIYRLRGFRCGY
ncbi:MAG: glycosyltransferase family 39 protein [Actinomycetes bacterium]